MPPRRCRRHDRRPHQRVIHPNQAPLRRTTFRRPAVADGRAIWDLARRSGTLDLNSPYAYLLLSHHFAGSGVVAEVGGDLAGFVVGYRPPTAPDVTFVWQVAVDEEQRGHGIGLAMLRQLVADAAPDGVRFLEATVTPGNEPSRRLFTALATSLDTEVVVSPLFGADDFPGDGHEAEHLFRIGPF